MTELKEKVRGWWFPIFLVDLYESRVINAEELLLLGKINSIEKCWASNSWLASWWGDKSPRWVSYTLHKLEEMKLLKIIYSASGRRRIRTCFEGDEGYRQGSKRVEEKFQKPRIKHPGDLSISKEYSLDKKERTIRRENSEANFHINGSSSNDRSIDFSPAVKWFARFSTECRFHIRPNYFNGGASHSPYVKGGQEGGWSRPTLCFWEKCYQELFKRYDDAIRIERVVKWFILHHLEEWVPVCHTFPSFCEKFDKIERMMKRNKKYSLPGDDDSGPTITSEKQE